jgi:hypothetical protein
MLRDRLVNSARYFAAPQDIPEPSPLRMHAFGRVEPLQAASSSSTFARPNAETGFRTARQFLDSDLTLENQNHRSYIMDGLSSSGAEVGELPVTLLPHRRRTSPSLHSNNARRSARRIAGNDRLIELSAGTSIRLIVRRGWNLITDQDHSGRTFIQISSTIRGRTDRADRDRALDLVDLA